MQRWTHFLLATFITSSFDARLPFLLVVVAGAVIVAINAAGAVNHDTAGAALSFGAAIGTEALAADRDWTGRTQGRGRSAILSLRMMLGLGCRGRSWSGSGDSGGVHAR